MATYAWSRFKKTVNEWGRVDDWIEPGEEISQSDLGVDDDEWQSLKDVGAVRDEPYPDIDDNVAPAEHFRSNPSEVEEVYLETAATEESSTEEEQPQKQSWQQ